MQLWQATDSTGMVCLIGNQAEAEAFAEANSGEARPTTPEEGARSIAEYVCSR